MADPDIDTLYKEFSGKSTPDSTVTAPTDSVDDLYRSYSTAPTKITVTPATPTAEELADPYGQGAALKGMGSGIVKGVSDVINTSSRGIDFVGRMLSHIAPSVFGSVEERERLSKENEARIAKENADFEAAQGSNQLATLGRIGGQVAATYPLVPAKVVQGIGALTRALPTISPAGTTVAAPLVNRLAASVGTGAVGGAVFGGATSAANDSSLGSNVATGAATGAIGGPIISVAGNALSRVLPAAQKAWANLIPIQQLARQSGAPTSAVKNVIEILENAGFTPATAQAALTKMGPSATLADLDPSITTELSGLASLGGKSTTIAKGRMAARAEQANPNANQIIEGTLGPKPDLEAEREAIKSAARTAVGPDYKRAYASGAKLDVSDIVQNIDDRLKTAVGGKAGVLKTAKSYLFQAGKDAQGNPISILKSDLPSLHEVRIGLDDVIEKAGTPETTLGKHALGAAQDIRNAIDAKLKSVPGMAAADTKFAQEMKVAEGLDYGKLSLTKGNKEEFTKVFNSSSPARQEAIRKGLRAAIGDYMDTAAKGELAGARQLFGSKAASRAKLRLAFGAQGDSILDALEQQGAFRATEGAVRSGSQTAERQAIQRKYGQAPSAGVGKEALKGLALDIAGGTPGLAAVYMGAKKYAGSRALHFSENRLGRLAEGTAELLSRQGVGRDIALSAMDKVNNIQQSIASTKSVVGKLKLPATLAPSVGEGTYETVKDKYKKVRRFI